MIEVRAIDKSYAAEPAPLCVLKDVSFRCDMGQITSIVGPSGCGKSTLLNVISGLDKPDRGSVETDRESGFAYMMQDALLLPWRTLAENALLGAEVRDGRSIESCRLVEKYFTAFDLGDALGFYPNAASGGMKQRAALIRTLITQPRTLLLDEPFASLDFDVKLKVQQHLIEYHERECATTLIVTHDIEDAIALSEKIIVLSGKPAKVKATIPIDLGTRRRDPIGARKSVRFSEYFARVWDEIKYLDDEGQTSATH
ncbi:MAG TPA: ABC transporter ATP-binding protein [Candidatus Dormibacteraeota bacterium]|nr:ABC transporter ATP-binding protein [Candidatus Dormibacteraeota bacterium]